MARFETRGHAAALAVVRRAIETGRPPHALLLSGPAQVGKTTLGVDLAAGLLCSAGQPTERPCRACAACRRVASGNHPDLHRLAPDGAGGQIRLGQVQALAGDLALLPLEADFRVAVIEQAQRLNQDAQHAILKTLEEPPARVVLVLAADEPAGLLPTVVSRCARLRLGSVSAQVVAELLVERGAADAARGVALGRLSGGRPGVALALAGDPDLLLAQSRLARTLLDLLSANRHVRLAAAAGLLADAALLVPSATSPGADRGARTPAKPTAAERRAAVAQLLGVWRLLARDIAVAAHGGLASIQQVELLDDLSRVAGGVDARAAAQFVERLDSVGRAIDGYANPELALDVLLLEWPSLPASQGVAA